MSKTVRFLVRLFWGVTASALILLAVMVQLGRSGSFLVSEYRQDLADYWSQKLQLQVEIGDLALVWEGLRPELITLNVRVSTPDGSVIAVLPSTRVELLLLPSLIQLQPVVAELQVTGGELAFEQAEDGRWSLQGLPLKPELAESDHPANHYRGNPFAVFLFARHLQLRDAALEFNFRNGEQFILQVPEIALNSSRNFHRLSLRMDVGERKNMVTLVIEGEGDPNDPKEFVSQGYLRIQQFPLNKVVSAAANRWPQGTELDFSAEAEAEGEVDLELWLQSNEQGFNWQGRLDVHQLPALVASAPGIDHLGTNIQGMWQHAGVWQLSLQDLQVQWQELLSLDVQLSSKGVGEPLAIAIDQLPLAALSRLASAHLSSDGKAFELLNTLNAQGNLRNALITLPLDSLKDVHFAANLDQVGVDALEGAPALTQVDGYISADQAGGLIELDSRHGFSMQYSIYADAMDYDSAFGAVAWHLRPDDNVIYVNSSKLSLRGEDGAAEGFLYLNMPWQKDSRDSEMTLQIGLTGSNVQYHSKYVPEVVPPTLHQWLDDSLAEGEIGWAGFIYRGSLSPNDAEGRTVQLAIDMDAASLDYHPRWPALSDIKGLLTIDDVEVNVDVERARLYDSSLSNTLVAVAPNAAGSGMLLEIRSQLAGPASDGLRVLRETMLRDTLGDGFDSWTLSGDMEAQLTLSIPLTPEQPGARQRVEVMLAESALTMASLGLEFKPLNGRLNFDEHQGLTAKNLYGKFFQQPFSASIASNPVAKTTRVQAQGAAAASAVTDWIKRPELQFVEGILPFNADLTLFHGDRKADKARLQISSNLRGASVTLPAPFAKLAAEERPLAVHIDMGESSTHYSINYADQAQFELLQTSAESPRMALGVQQAAKLPELASFSIAGQLERFDFLTWRETYERYQGFAEALTSVQQLATSKGEMADVAMSSEPLKVDFNARVQSFVLGDFKLDNILVSGGYSNQGWALNIENPTVKGGLLVHNDARPLQVDLQYLRLAKASPLESNNVNTDMDTGQPDSELNSAKVDIEVNDILSGVDPLALPAMDFSTDELFIGAEDYGSWRFAMRPSKEGLALDSIFANVKGLTITGIKDDSNGGIDTEQGASLIWRGRGDMAYTEFKGVLSSDDLSSTLAQFNQPGLLESEQARFVADLGWQGSPAAIGLNQLEGGLALDIDKGRFLRDGNSGNNPLLRLLGLLNFDTLLRRLQLDFSDMVKSGMVFDSVKGELQFSEGNLYLEQPLKVRTPSSRLQLAGTIDLKNEKLDATLVAALPVASPLALFAALTAGLPMAAGVYIVGKIFEEQVDKLTSLSYHIDGDWADPQIEFGQIFDAKAVKRSAKEAKQKNEQQNKAAELSAQPL